MAFVCALAIVEASVAVVACGSDPEPNTAADADADAKTDANTNTDADAKTDADADAKTDANTNTDADANAPVLGVFISPFNDDDADTSWDLLGHDLVDAGIRVFVVQATAEALCEGDVYKEGSASNGGVRTNIAAFLDGVADATAEASVYLGTTLARGPNGSGSEAFWEGTGVEDAGRCFTRARFLEAQDEGKPNLVELVDAARTRGLFRGFYLTNEFPIMNLGDAASVGMDIVHDRSLALLKDIQADAALIVSPTFPEDPARTDTSSARERILHLSASWSGPVIVAPQDGVGSFGHDAGDAYLRLGDLRSALADAHVESWINVEAFLPCGGGLSARATEHSFHERLLLAREAGVSTILFYDAQWVFSHPGHPSRCAGGAPSGDALKDALGDAGLLRR